MASKLARRTASREFDPLCDPNTHCGMARNGEDAGSGSTSKTSRAAADTWPL